MVRGFFQMRFQSQVELERAFATVLGYDTPEASRLRSVDWQRV